MIKIRKTSMQEQTPVKIDSYQATLRTEMGWYDLTKRAERARTFKDEISRYKKIQDLFAGTDLEEAISKLTEEFRKNPAAPHLLDLCLRQGRSLLGQENYTDALKVIQVGLGYGSDQSSAPGRPQPGVAPNDTAEGTPFVGMEPSRLHTLRMLQAVAQILNASTKQDITELVEQAQPLQSLLDQLELPEAVCQKLQEPLLAAYRNILTDENIFAEDQSDALTLLSDIMHHLFPEQAKELIKELEQRKAVYHIDVVLLIATRLQQQAEEQLNHGDYTRAGEYNKKALENLQLLEGKYVASMSLDKHKEYTETQSKIKEQERDIERTESHKQLQTKLEQARDSYTRMLQAGGPLEQPSEAAGPPSAQSAFAGHALTQAAGAEPGSSAAAAAATDQLGPTLDQAREQCAEIVKTANNYNFTELATEATTLQTQIRQFQSLWEAQQQELAQANAMLQAARLAETQLAIELANRTIETCRQIRQNIPDYANTAEVLSAAENLLADRKSNLAAPLEPPPTGSLDALATEVAKHLQRSTNVTLDNAQIDKLATSIADNIERPAPASPSQQRLPTMLTAANLLVLIVFLAVQAFNSMGRSGAVGSATASPTTTTIAAASTMTGDSDRGIQPWQTRPDYTTVVPTQIGAAEENPAISEPDPTHADEPTSEPEPTTTAMSTPAPTETGTPPVTVTIDTEPFDRPEVLFDLPLTITGTADPGSELTLMVINDGQTSITATVSVADNGNWTWNPPLDQPALASGSYTLQVTTAAGGADKYSFEVLEATRVSVPANVGVRDRCGKQESIQTLGTVTDMEIVGQAISPDDDTQCYQVRYNNQRRLYWIWRDALDPNQPDPTNIPDLTEQPEPTPVSGNPGT
jgi:hypothetical protein